MTKLDSKQLNEMVKTIMLIHPDLTAHGYDRDKQHNFKNEREELYKLGNEIEYCIEYLQFANRIKSINYKKNSYGYKHRVEKWIKEKYDKHVYISNGSFIIAALILGFKMTKNKLNPSFNISNKFNNDLINKINSRN
jgi:hypothetical protein